ncbi:MAG: hypothetical protein QXD52_02545 [Candidatus Bathyarchaeia archaeon]
MRYSMPPSSYKLMFKPMPRTTIQPLKVSRRSSYLSLHVKIILVKTSEGNELTPKRKLRLSKCFEIYV